MRRARATALAARLRALQPWERHEYHPEFLSYQSCRFCRRSAYETGALWKYEVRHYICDQCKGERS